MYENRWTARLMASFAILWLIAALAPAVAADYANPQLLTSTDALQRMLNRSDVRIVDVRPRAAYFKGHIPGAVHLGADDVIDPNSHVDGDLLPPDRLAAMLGQRGIGELVDVEPAAVGDGAADVRVADLALAEQQSELFAFLTGREQIALDPVGDNRAGFTRGLKPGAPHSIGPLTLRLGTEKVLANLSRGGLRQRVGEAHQRWDARPP